MVDDWHLFSAPVIEGGGKQSRPDNFRLELELLDEQWYRNGMVHLHYRTRT